MHGVSLRPDVRGWEAPLSPSLRVMEILPFSWREGLLAAVRELPPLGWYPPTYGAGAGWFLIPPGGYSWVPSRRGRVN